MHRAVQKPILIRVEDPWIICVVKLLPVFTTPDIRAESIANRQRKPLDSQSSCHWVIISLFAREKKQFSIDNKETFNGQES
jgi:hypothetical protein